MTDTNVTEIFPVLTVDKVVLPTSTLVYNVGSTQAAEALNAAYKNTNHFVAVFFKPTTSYTGVTLDELENTLPIGLVGQCLDALSENTHLIKLGDTVNIKLLYRVSYLHKNTTTEYPQVAGITDATLANTEITKGQLANYSSLVRTLGNYGETLLPSYKEIQDLAAIAAKSKCQLDLSNVCEKFAMEFFKDASDSLQTFLLTTNLDARLQIILGQFNALIVAFQKITNMIEKLVSTEVSKEQKEYYLRKQLKIIQEELGDVSSATKDSTELQDKITNGQMPESIKEYLKKELRRYQSTTSASPESTMIRAYLDLILDLPWGKFTEDSTDINKAKEKLDETHFGLEKVKDRILEYLSVKLYTGKTPQTILCFVGPPGVGKTTLAKSIADALGRKFIKQSMGSVKDEAEIRGHRRTYIGALPGRIINGIKEAGVSNPVFLLDEIDKIGSDYKGDPSNALLEVLDPSQNAHFMDHYTEIEYDLSKVLFICTANYIGSIPEPLKDRLEIITLSSYTDLEKLQIAKDYLVKRCLEKNGLEETKFSITDEALKELITHYTAEAGVRQLERCIDSLVRKTIKKILAKEAEKVTITPEDLVSYLGKEAVVHTKAIQEDSIGRVNGLGVTAYGGEILPIEALAYPGHGGIHMTGNLGQVLNESIEVAYSVVKNHILKQVAETHAIGLSTNETEEDSPMDRALDKLSRLDLHIHILDGSIPKDGPSGGVALATVIYSVLKNIKIDHTVGMTGEISLTGEVHPIGGVKEKLITAYKCGLKKVLIPADNVKDLEDLPKEVIDGLIIKPVKTWAEVLTEALIKDQSEDNSLIF